MSTIFVKPAQGARVRMPERGSTVMDTEGAWVPRSVHYEALLGSGDIVLADPQPQLPGAEGSAARDVATETRTATTAAGPSVAAPSVRATSASSKEN